MFVFYKSIVSLESMYCAVVLNHLTCKVFLKAIMSCKIFLPCKQNFRIFVKISIQKMNHWVTEAKKMAVKNGNVDLTRYSVKDLNLLPILPTMHTLDISFCQIFSLHRMKDQLSVKKFIADNTPINSLSGFIAIRNVTNISLKNTPVALQDNIIISLLIICPNLVVYNGKVIPNRYRKIAKSAPPQSFKLINAGLEIDYPFDTIEIQYQINKFNLGELFNIPSPIKSPHKENSASDDNISIYSTASSKYRKHFPSPKNNAKPLVKAKSTPRYDAKLLFNVKNVLAKNGFEINQSSKTSTVLKKISELLNQQYTKNMMKTSAL